jgi:hypothetical protein
MRDKELEDALLAAFERAAGGQAITSQTGRSSSDGLEGSVSPSAARESQGIANSPDRAISTTGNDASSMMLRATVPVTQVATSPAQARSDSGRTGGNVAATVLKTGLGTVPLARLVASFFTGGGEADEPPPLLKFALPAPIRIEKANAPAGADGRLRFGEISYGQNGDPRLVGAERSETSRSSWNPRGSDDGGDGARAGTVQPTTPLITVNVQAMDSRSFLDHSGEIAQAVRHAMLNMHALNDVVNEL